MPKYHSGEVQMLGISHSGVRLIKRSRTKAANDVLQVLETFPFESMQQTSPIRNGSTIDVRLTKKRITIHSHRVRSHQRPSTSTSPAILDSKNQTNDRSLPQRIPCRPGKTLSHIQSCKEHEQWASRAYHHLFNVVEAPAREALA